MSCASSGPVAPDLGPDGVIVTRAELTSLKALAGEVEALGAQLGELRAENGALRERVASLEVRTGLAPFEPKTLTRMEGAVVLPDAVRVERQGDRGHRASLSRHLAKTKGIVLAFWATWCVPCTSEPELKAVRELRRQLRAQGADLVSMAIDGLDRVKRDYRAGTWVYPLWQRDQGHLSVLPKSFLRGHGVSLPLFVVISPSGEARWYREGALSPEAIAELVDASIQARDI